MPEKQEHIHILGGGPAGLAYAYYGLKAGHTITLYEKNSLVGGNCVTTCKNGFYWDSGAHRIHNVYKDITDEIRLILNDKLHEVNAPSHIFLNGRFIPFPFNIINVVKILGATTFTKATLEVVFSKKKRQPVNFKEYAVQKYGYTLARPLLLNYTEKLWGVSTDDLSIHVTGRRLNGLTPWRWLAERFTPNLKKPGHLEGKFYYPRNGIGELAEKTADSIGRQNIKTSCAITAIYHQNNTITHIEINGEHLVEAGKIISTLPLPLMAGLFKPALPQHIMEASRKLVFRNLIIVAFALKKTGVSNSASIYFPGEEIFTRVVEPRNRSVKMSPEGFTSLIAEIPCFKDDGIWQNPDDEVIEAAKNDLVKTGLCKPGEIMDAWVQRLPFAYPVLSNNAVEALTHLQEYFGRFNNLTLAGRNGNFSYTHVHDLFYEARHHFA